MIHITIQKNRKYFYEQLQRYKEHDNTLNNLSSFLGKFRHIKTFKGLLQLSINIRSLEKYMKKDFGTLKS